MSPLISVEGVHLHYGSARALADVSFEVEEGAALAILGANGAGKTTLARSLAGLARPNAGRITFDGRDLRRLSPHRIARLGMTWIPEGRGVFPGLSVLDNLRAQLQQAAPRSKRPAALDRAFELFPVLHERRHQRAATLSGGEQQMLALSRVLAVPPRVVVADEMSLGLAPRMVAMIFQGLAEARSAGVTIVLIEQFVDKALAFCDEAVVLRRGEVAWSGTAADAKPEVLDAYLGPAQTGV